MAALPIILVLLGSVLAVAPGQESVAVGAAEMRRPVVEEFAEKVARIPVTEAQRRVAEIDFPAQEARFVRLAIRRTSGNSEPCLDELEIYGPDGTENLALASRGAVASASSLLPGYAIHAVEHLNDGQYGNSHSWISATPGEAWAQIELPEAVEVARVVISRDREGKFQDRIPTEAQVLLSLNGTDRQPVAMLDSKTSTLVPRRRNPLSQFDLMPHLRVDRLTEKNWHGVVQYAFLRERDTWSRIPKDDYLSPLVTERPAYPGGAPYWGTIARLAPLERVLALYSDLIDRLEERGLDVSADRRQLAQFQAAADGGAAAGDDLYLAARWAKRRLFFRDPSLAPLEHVLFAKRHPFLESHNYSEHLDGCLEPGGGVYVLHVPLDAQGGLIPEQAEIEELFDGSAGIVREPVPDDDAQTVFFAYRPDAPEVEGWDSYWHMYSLSLNDGKVRQLTDGPFHDFDPAVLPDGGVAFITTRCALRFLCWRPQAYVLYRMERDGTAMKRLSYANLSEWKPSVMSDGLILWTRSEYIDKGADFSHTLWTIRPDGTHPALVFGNNTPNCYSQAHGVPETNEIICTLMSHGSHEGPIALIDRGKDPFDTSAITNITPDTHPYYQMDRSYFDTFRDPYPVSSDYFVVSHNPDNHHSWGIYVIDRYGNRELLYIDPGISSTGPRPLRPRPRPPVLASSINPDLAKEGLGRFTLQDVYLGLGPEVARGRIKYIRVAEEVPADLAHLPNGECQNDHPPFQDFYASPTHLVKGHVNSYLTRTPNVLVGPIRTNHDWSKKIEEVGEGLYRVSDDPAWPTYEAKMSYGIAPVAEDGSADFLAPAGKQLYFQVLDEDFNEIQRMRSVIQLQPGEARSCIGCHESRQTTSPVAGLPQTMGRPPDRLEPPPWGAVPFSYEKVVQPVLDRQCVSCHDGSLQGARPDLCGRLDKERIPTSYRSLIEGGWVHYFDYTWGIRPFKAEPLSFGTLQSRLWEVLDDQDHEKVTLTRDEMRAVKAWVDLNCPLWPDYTFRLDRPGPDQLLTSRE
ncbi:MAG TPA: hypothetical protein PLO37_23170 [Candidatus Hydrogenedentes bacterium]|nr:hypothetical protein [Candidatus Hydrogenedentota bacterium]HPG69761.1 hypothetical protein [Candidatus Hydrogenedentota bacterium]